MHHPQTTEPLTSYCARRKICYALKDSLKKNLLLFCLLLTAAATRVSAAETVTITEFLANNTTSLRDEDGDSSDWIEIFNSGATTTNIGGWVLPVAPRNPNPMGVPSTHKP